MRSPHAHARIRRIDVAEALAAPGVIAVLTGADAVADGLQPLPHRPVPSNPYEVPLRSRDGSAFFLAPHPPLPADRARFVGEAVAMVVADTRAAARDGAERVTVDYESLPAVTATAEAAAADAPILWHETRSNVCVDADVGDAAVADAAFRRAAHVVRLKTWVQRVTGVPLEPRAALGAYDEATGRYTLYAGVGVALASDEATAAEMWTRYGEGRPRTPDTRVLAVFGICGTCYEAFGRDLLPDLLDAILTVEERGARASTRGAMSSTGWRRSSGYWPSSSS